MCEAFGLDRRIDNYKGKRHIGLYRLDIEYLVEVVSSVIDNPKKYPDKNTKEYQAMKNLYEKLKKLYGKAFSK